MNLIDQIPEVTRRVLADAPSGTVGVELARSFAASGRELWEAITEADRREIWFGPAEAKVIACEPEELLRVKWEGGILEIAFADNTLTLTHTFPRDELWDTYGPALAGIDWDTALASLSLHLAMDAESDEGEEETFIRRLAEEWSVDKQQAQRAVNLFLE